MKIREQVKKSNINFCMAIDFSVLHFLFYALYFNLVKIVLNSQKRNKSLLLQLPIYIFITMRLTISSIIICILGLICHSSYSQHSQELATPSPVQYRWQEQERIMFIHYRPATWQGREYDDLSDLD